MKFPNEASEFVYVRTYARWREDLGRRETWEDTVSRVVGFLKEQRPQVPDKVYKKIENHMMELSTLPSMRLVWTAGDAALSDNLGLYNCSFVVLDSIQSFAEMIYLLMHGAGVGFSVQKKYVSLLPEIKPNTFAIKNFVIEDSRLGWAESVRFLLENEFNGIDVTFDYSQIRKKGTRLKTFGGRASGPEPLAILHSYIKNVFDLARGRRLKTIECHDIACQIAESVVMGGVRRSSLISLFDYDDQDMINSKAGCNWPKRRMMANNSMVCDSKPTASEFLKVWATLATNGTGEPGIFNLGQAVARSPDRRDSQKIVGCNPCAEALLRHKGLCNLSSVVLRADDDLDDVFDKIEAAVWIGAIQSTFTDFHFISPEWKENCEEERLLGVSLSGQMDAPHLITPDNLTAMRKKALKVAKKAAKHLEINVPAAITVVKPEGTSSQLTDASSGMHPRYAKYYIRRYRISANDPLLKMMRDQGFKIDTEVGQNEPNVSTYVVEFPIKAPEKCITRHDVSAIQQLEHYRIIQENWCEMNASMTIYVKEDEWFEVGNWVYKNWDIVSGLSFLPFDGGNYKLAPYEEITEERYVEMIKDRKPVDYSQLVTYEKEDNTTGAKTLACSGDKCDI